MNSFAAFPAIMLLFAHSAFGAEAPRAEVDLLAISDEFVSAKYPDIELSEHRSEIEFRDGRAYIIYIPTAVNQLGGGAVVMLDKLTGEVLESVRTQ